MRVVVWIQVHIPCPEVIWQTVVAGQHSSRPAWHADDEHAHQVVSFKKIHDTISNQEHFAKNLNQIQILNLWDTRSEERR